MSILCPAGRSRGSSLVTILVVVLFIAILCAVVLPRYLAVPTTAVPGSAPGAGATVRTDTAASDAVCRTNVAAARQAVAVYRTSHAGAALPASLSEVELGPDLLRCPVGGEPYTYDRSTGAVQCPHPGHDGY